MTKVTVIGGGLAGAEASLYLANHNMSVDLIEMKPRKMSPAHSMNGLGELVCSNSLKSTDITTAGGLFKAELNLLGCSLLGIAESVRVPAGNALAVDRERFSQEITRIVKSHPLINIVEQEAADWDTSAPTIIATGPLTSDALSNSITNKFGDNLHFFDAVAPIVALDSIDMDIAFYGSRYNKGTSDYINCPFNKEQYLEFYNALVSAECVDKPEWDKINVFEGCMPIELMAKRGTDTIRFGPLKPVGIEYPNRDNGNNDAPYTNSSDQVQDAEAAIGTKPIIYKRPYAVVQLRKENQDGSAYNIVGFQTNLKWGEQKRVFSLIPALKDAEFLRYGVMHRNSFIQSPHILNNDLSTKQFPMTYFAGQLCGVEGYVESIGTGLLAAINLVRKLDCLPPLILPTTTILGSLMSYISSATENFQPMNANFGILPPLSENIRDKAMRKSMYSERAISDLSKFLNQI